MGKNDIKVSKKQNSGFRTGITWEDCLKNLSEDDKSRIILSKELENREFDLEDVYKCGAHSDQMFKQWLEKVNIIRESVRLIVQSQTHVTKNKVDLNKGETKRKFPDTDTLMSLRDLEMENYKVNIIINKNLSDLRTFLYDIHRYSDCERIDRMVFFPMSDYEKLFNEVKDELGKVGIDLYKKTI